MENIKVMVWNARGISGKWNEFSNYVSPGGWDLVCVSETWLRADSVPKTIIGFSHVRLDKPNGLSESLLIFTRDSIVFRQLHHLCGPPGSEVLAVQLRFDDIELNIDSIYNPPDNLLMWLKYGIFLGNLNFFLMFC